MELTIQQIQKVEQYLNAKRIDYIDIRLEVLDHIVSDIEVLIERETIDFETAFYKVTNKWNLHLKETSSFYFGIMYSAPKILIDKAKKTFRKYFFMLFAFYFFPLIFFSNIYFSFSKNAQNYFNQGFKTATIFLLMISIYVLINKDKSKLKTTFSFILKSQSLGIFIGFILVLCTTFFDKTNNFNGIALGLFLSFIYQTLVYFYFYKKHKEAIKKYNIS
tara:strand:- start:662 stop:1318 length:657 start_codon:yes stop_codon:yes gene_type:complete